MSENMKSAHQKKRIKSAKAIEQKNKSKLNSMNRYFTKRQWLDWSKLWLLTLAWQDRPTTTGPDRMFGALCMNGDLWFEDLVALRQRHEELNADRSEEHTSELQSLMRISYAVFCLKTKQQRSKC